MVQQMLNVGHEEGTKPLGLCLQRAIRALCAPWTGPGIWVTNLLAILCHAHNQCLRRCAGTTRKARRLSMPDFRHIMTTLAFGRASTVQDRHRRNKDLSATLQAPRRDLQFCTECAECAEVLPPSRLFSLRHGACHGGHGLQ